jgi:hypothetical protein
LPSRFVLRRSATAPTAPPRWIGSSKGVDSIAPARMHRARLLIRV